MADPAETLYFIAVDGNVLWKDLNVEQDGLWENDHGILVLFFAFQMLHWLWTKMLELPWMPQGDLSCIEPPETEKLIGLHVHYSYLEI